MTNVYPGFDIYLYPLRNWIKKPLQKIFITAGLYLNAISLRFIRVNISKPLF